MRWYGVVVARKTGGSGTAPLRKTEMRTPGWQGEGVRGVYAFLNLGGEPCRWLMYEGAVLRNGG